MRYRPLGTTGVKLSEITFGTGDTAGALVYGDGREQREIVAAALELGINIFDTSPDYGKGLTEVNLGRALRETGGADALVMTKVEIMPEHLDLYLDRIAERVVESVEDSLTRLRRDHIDILVLHNPCRPERNPTVRMPWTPLTPDRVLGDVLEGMARAKAAGKVRFLGASCERAVPASVATVLDSGEFQLINVWFNLANPSAGSSVPVPGIPDEGSYTGLIDTAASRDVAVAVIRPLAGGALSSAIVDSGAQARHRLSGGVFTWQPELFEPERLRGHRFGFLDRPDQPIAETAYRYVLSNPEVTTVIGGFSEAAHVRQAVHAVG
jgi:aryl-alcohol dehydrogenase-like predicted oxidoreductase